jgi:hypothetical protein
MRKRLVEQIFKQAKENNTTIKSACKRAGLSESSVRSWRRCEPLLGNFIALVEVLGGKVTITWKEKGVASEHILPRHEP